MRYNTGVANEINSRSGAGNTLRLDTRKAILMHPHFNRATGAAQASPVNKTSKRPRKLQITKKRDGAKTEWAARNGYILIRVPYTVVNIRDFLVEKIYHGA